jgi:hypothetical protein
LGGTRLLDSAGNVFNTANCKLEKPFLFPVWGECEEP